MPTAFTSGLGGLAADLQGWAAVVRFARPDLLWLLLLPAALRLLDLYAARRRRAAAALVGRPGALAALAAGPRAGGRGAGAAYTLGLVLLVVGLAGPRWGKSDEPGVAVGRDLVVVVDVSRSMLADDMNDPTDRERWQAARAGVRDLMAAVARRGGHRVGLVVFAGRPVVVCPLTTDYDHVRNAVDELSGRYPPPEAKAADGITSGTRIGAALKAAVDAHDPRFPGSRDIILLSDGDDPAGNREWEAGADAARRAEIPVHVVGLGDPAHASPVVVRDGFLEVLGPDGNPVGQVETRLREEPLTAIAAETRGQYLASRQRVPALGEFFRSRVEPFPSREVSDDALPQPKERYVWFLLPALALFGVRWWGGH